MPGMGGMYGGMYGMPRPPMFGSPYMSRMPFMNYAGMANPMNRSIFGGYGYGYGPGMGMAPLSYYGGYGGGMDPNIDGFKKYPIGYDYGSSNFMRPQRRMIE